jgi:transposase-like protein
MKKPTTITPESVSEYRDFVELRLRKRVLEAIEIVLDEEVDQALGCRAYERSEERRGYRNGVESRRVTTAVGTRELRVPRARVRDEETGETKEFRSELLPRYQRRTREVDDAILATYLSGANSRRIRKALKPLLGDEHLSKSSVSRVVSRLKERLEEWQSRDLSKETYAIVFLDGFHLKVRMAKRVVSVPVLAALGVAPDGQKRLLSLRLAVSEASTHWGSLIEDLQVRGLPAPKLVVSDGHKGLTKALEKWPESRLQRCVQHKSANLLGHCPAHARRELKRDYRRIVWAKDGIEARRAYAEFVTKWAALAPAVVRSLEEAGERLLTFYEFPRAMWKSLRTTNALENLNREFRRRTKTQASFTTEASAVALLFGLVASGQIRLRRIDGYQHLAEVLARGEVAA